MFCQYRSQTSLFCFHRKTSAPNLMKLYTKLGDIPRRNIGVLMIIFFYCSNKAAVFMTFLFAFHRKMAGPNSMKLWTVINISTVQNSILLLLGSVGRRIFIILEAQMHR